MTAAMMKARGFPDPDLFWPPLALFVRSWGFLLIFIPGLWVILSIWLEGHPRFEFSKSSTVVTGFILLAGLTWLMIKAVLLGFGAGFIQVVE